jgi:hypothetical protein
MKIKSIWLTGIVMLLPGMLGAQSFTETALMFSRITPGGSARIQAMGGAQTSLGGDYSSAFSNPAGLGMFNRSEFSISPGFNSASIQSDYLGNSTSTTKTNLHIPGFGLVFQNNQNRSKGFLSGAFAISFNRVNNFNQSFKYQGTNSNNSIIDYFIEDANGYPSSQFDGGGRLFNTPTYLAYQNYLIGDETVFGPDGDPAPPNPDPTKYFTDIQGIPFQQEVVESSGAQNQWSLSYGLNINDRIFIGAGIGFTSIKFKVDKFYGEDFTQDPLSKLVLEENLKIQGSGVNGSIGLIVRVIDPIQVGLTYSSPTFYQLTDTYSSSMTTDWNNYDYYYYDYTDNVQKYTTLNEVDWNTDELISEYELRTPSRLSLGASFFIQKYGLISADVEMVNYSGTKYSSGISGIDFSSDNDDIKSLYQTTFNYRLGGEFRYENLRARAGFSYMPDPFQSEQNGVNRAITSISGGLGYRNKKFYIDAALVFTEGNNSYRPYRVNTPESPLVTLKNSTTFGMLTIGFPF